MASNTVNIALKLTAEGVEKQVRAARETADEYARANKELARTPSLRHAQAASPRSAAQRSAPHTSSTVTEREYGKVRGAVGTGAAGRDFAKQAQGLGGLVALYATFAANIFAVGAAYTALDKAASTERLAKATEMMSVSTGIHLKSVSKNLVEASGYALSFSEAMQFTNIGTSAGLASRQIESLTKIAKGAANALGRDVGDSVRRIIQGTAKQEQEILDELGIFVKASQAYEKFSAINKIKVADMTGAQRTQAYANEVERLGAKWNDFAEIPDPFSKFAATGKNALNELLNSVNKVFIPLVSFLSESKEGVQALIVLITAGLTKRALPEIGGMLNNLFTYDKKLAAAKSSEAIATIRAANAAVLAEYHAANNKLAGLKKTAESLVLPTIDKATTAGIMGAAASTTGKNKEFGVSPVKVANLIEAKGATTLLDTQKNITKALHEQLTATKLKEEMMASLIKKGILEKTSTIDKLVLDKEGLLVAERVYALATPYNTALERRVVLEKEIAAAANSVVVTGKAATKVLNSEIETMSTVGNTAAVASNTKARVSNTIATEAGIIAASSRVGALTAETVSLAATTTAEARLLAVREAGTAGALAQNAAASSGLISSFNAMLTSMKGIIAAGYGESLVSTAASTGILAKASTFAAGVMSSLKMQIVGYALAFPALGKAIASAMLMIEGASVAAAVAVKLLGSALKFTLTALSAVAMPLMLAWTAWEMFGDKIKGWLGYDSKAQKALEDQKVKLKEYEEGTSLAAVSMERVNRARLEGIDSMEKKAHWDNLELKVLQEQIDRRKNLADEEKTEKDKVTIEAAKAKAVAAGITFSGDAYLAEQNAKAASIEGDILKSAELLKLASAYQQLANAKALTDKNPTANTGMSKAYEDELNARIALAQKKEEDRRIELQQLASHNNKVETLNKTFLDAIDHATTESAKKGSKELGIYSEKAVAAYTQLTGVFSASGVEALNFQSSLGGLGKMISNGGTQAAAALPMYLALAKILTDPKASTKEGLAALLKENEEALKAGAKAVAKALDTGTAPKAPKAIVPYTPASKNLFAALKNDIDETALKLKQLSGEQAASAAIESRLTSIRGATSAEAIATAKKLTDKQAELTLTKEMTSAILEYEKVIKDRSKTGADGVAARKEATESLENKKKEAIEIKKQADILSYINTVNSLIAKSTADQTTELKKRAEMEGLATGYAEQKRAASEADLEYAIERGYLTSKEIVDAQYLLELEKQKAAAKAGIDANSRRFQEDIAPQLAVLSTPGDTEGDLRGKELARAKLVEIEESYKRQNALILSGAEGLAFQTSRAHELKSAIAGSTDNMDKMKNITESLAVVFGELGSSMGAAGEAILKMAQDEEKHAKAKKSFEEQRDDPNSDMKDRRIAVSEIGKIEKKEAKDKLSNIGKVAGATKSMFKEHTFAYKALAAVEKVTHIMKMGMMATELIADTTGTAVSVANSGTRTAASMVEAGVDGVKAVVKAIASMPFPLNIAAGVATAAVVAQLLGGIGGKGPTVTAPGGFTAEEQQKSQGTGMSWGTVDGKNKLVENGMGTFGDASAKSESIVNSLEIMKANSIEGLDYDNQMLKAMQRVADAIGTAATSIYQIPGIRMGSAFGTEEGTTGGTTLGWGKTRSTNIEDSGIKLQGTFAELASSVSKAAQVYENIKTTTQKETWFSSKTSVSFDTKLLDLEKEQAKAIADIFTNATSVFVEIGKTAGVTEDAVRSTLGALDIDLKASTRGLTGEDLEKELNAVIGGALSQGAKAIFAQFDKFKKFGEDYLQTTIRVVDGNNKVDQALRSMGNTFDVTRDYITRTKIAFWRFNTTVSKFDISEALIKGAGGLENFMEQASFFTDSFLTDEERLAPIQEAVSERLKDLGLSSTLSRDSFKKLVLAQDLSSEAGRTMYQNLMELAPGFDQVTKGIDDTVKKLGSFEEAIYKLRGDTGKALALARARELEETDVRLRASQTYVWALEDEVSIKDKLTASINNNISSLKSNIKTLADYSEKLKLGTSSVMTPAQKYAEAKNQLGSVFALASSSPTTDAEKAARNEAVGKLSSASETFLTMSKTMFASSEQYVQDYQSILQMLGTAEEDMKGQLTDAEKQLEEVKTSNSYLKNMDESTYSTARLMQQFLTAASASETARVAAGESGSLAALAIPARASGGYASGLTLVGENGPELANFTKPAMVYSNEASNDLLNTKELVAEIRSLHKELAQLRKDQQEQTGHLIATNYDANQKAAAQVTKSSESVAATNLWVQRSQPKIA